MNKSSKQSRTVTILNPTQVLIHGVTKSLSGAAKGAPEMTLEDGTEVYSYRIGTLGEELNFSVRNGMVVATGRWV